MPLLELGRGEPLVQTASQHIDASIGQADETNDGCNIRNVPDIEQSNAPMIIKPMAKPVSVCTKAPKTTMTRNKIVLISSTNSLTPTTTAHYR